MRGYEGSRCRQGESIHMTLLSQRAGFRHWGHLRFFVSFYVFFFFFLKKGRRRFENHHRYPIHIYILPFTTQSSWQKTRTPHHISFSKSFKSLSYHFPLRLLYLITSTKPARAPSTPPNPIPIKPPHTTPSSPPHHPPPPPLPR